MIMMQSKLLGASVYVVIFTVCVFIGYFMGDFIQTVQKTFIIYYK